MTTSDLQRIAMVSNGAGAIVLPSLHATTLSCGQAPEFFSVPRNEDEYLRLVSQVAEMESVPVIASLHGGLDDDWADFPARLEEAGAVAVELSVRKPRDHQSDPQQIEDAIVNLAARVGQELEVPLLLKLSSGFTSISHLARRVRSSVRGVVLFGSSPVLDIELDTMKLTTCWGLSRSGSLVENLETLICVRREFPQMPLVACGGVATSIDLIKALIVGCDAATVTSAIYRHGPSVIGSMRDGLVKFMSDHDIDSVFQLHRLCPSLTDLHGECVEAEEIPTDYARPQGWTTDEAAIQADRYGHPEVEPTGARFRGA